VTAFKIGMTSVVPVDGDALGALAIVGVADVLIVMVLLD
jgi:hypothetical protein